MMGLFDDLFGGTKRTQTMTDEQVDMLNKLSYWTNAHIGKGIDGYEGQIAPDASSLQTQAFDFAGGLLGNRGAYEGARNTFNTAMQGQPVYEHDPVAVGNYFDSAVGAPAQIAFDDQLRGLDQRYGDRWSQDAGAHRAAVGDATARFHTGLAGQRAGMQYQDRLQSVQSGEMAANRALTGAQGALGVEQAQLAPLGAVAGLGGTQRQIAGQQGSEAYNKWLMEQPWANPWLGFTGQVLSAQPYAVTGQQGAIGAVGGAIGSVGQGIGALMGG